MTRAKRFGAAALCVLLALLCCACQQEGQPPALVGSRDLYTEAVLQTMPGLRLEEADEELWGSRFHRLAKGNVLQCYDAQAVPAVRQGVGSYWYPQCLATVVIAVDRAQTDAAFTGWQDLAESSLPVSWVQDKTGRRLLLGALAYGLEGEDFTGEETLAFLEALQAAGRFSENDWSAPVLVCFDYQAAEAVRAGRPLELIVPREGTLSYQMGLLSTHLLDIPPDEALLAGGLRLADGRCTDPAYPAYEQYAPARQLEHFSRLLEVTQDTQRDMARRVTHRRLFSSADGREHIMFPLVGIILVIFWAGTTTHRAIRADIQRAIRLLACCVVGWLVLRLFKYQLLTEGLLNRLCWYGYYIFQMGLPLTMLYITSIIDRPEAGGAPPRWMRWVAAVYPALLVLVFTNDWHQLVFRFDPAGPWDDAYTYGPGYGAVMAYCILTFGCSVVLLIKKSWSSPRRIGWLLPGLLAGLMVAYSVAYALNVPLARDSDLTVTLCAFSVLFFESALSTGLIPSNTRYGLLFEAAPINMQLLDDQGRTVLAARSATPLEPILRVQIQSAPSVQVNRDRDTLLMGRRVHGGTVVWQEDVGPMNRLHAQIQASVTRLEAANSLLSRVGQVRRQKKAAEVKERLFTLLEREIEEKTAELARAIQTLPQAPDKERRTAYITLLLCHIKRRCNLFFLAQEGGSMDGDELAIYLDELSEFAGYAGVHALTRCSLPASMEVRQATLCYDFYFSVLAWSVRGSRDTLLGQLDEGPEGLCFRVLSSEAGAGCSFSPSFLQAVEEAGGSVSVKAMEDTAGMYLTFPRGTGGEAP